VEHYWFELASDSLFAVSIVVDSTLTDTTTQHTLAVLNQNYWWRVRAGNTAGWGPFSLTRRFTPVAGMVSLHVPFPSGWSMLSNPVTTDADSVRELYPAAALSHGFSFSPAGGYTQSERMMEGRGYWVKLGEAGTSDITGFSRPGDTIAVEPGWNMIGSISFPVAVSAITSIPPGIQGSAFYGYDGTGYFFASTIEPGRAYWVKTDSAGFLLLASGEARPPSGTAGRTHK
jgi:hypothetical protein